MATTFHIQILSQGKPCASDFALVGAKSEVLNFSAIAEAMGKIGKTEADTVRYRLYFGSTGTITYHPTLKKITHKQFLWIVKSQHNDAREKNVCCFSDFMRKLIDNNIRESNHEFFDKKVRQLLAQLPHQGLAISGCQVALES